MTLPFGELAVALARGETPAGVEILKRSPVRCVARIDDAVLKVALRRPRSARREARVLVRARELGLPVPELRASGANWLATNFIEGRAAQRGDLPALLELIARMHAVGMLHRDLHLGNLHVAPGGPVLLDVQKARFWRRLPRWLRARELGYFAYSLGEPLPAELAQVARWRDKRAQRHWRSRTRRCTVESSGFTRFRWGQREGWRRREADPAELSAAIAGREDGERIKDDGRVRLVRSAGRIAKCHASTNRARAAWTAAHGLEVRGIAVARPLVWWERWLVMEDAGPTLSAWIDSDFARASETQQRALAEALGELLAALHRRGIYHADLKANNIAWSPGREPALLDYERVHFGRSVSRRRRVKNLAQLNAALPDLVPGALRELALRRYEAALSLGPDLRLRADVIRESLRRAHRWSGC